MRVENAIKYLEESKCDQHQGDSHQKYHNEVLDLAINALEKQIPKKPAKHPTLKNELNWLCPTCNRLYWKPNHNYLNDCCGSCGQKLDWDNKND